jgi:hypothetical protein
MSCVQPQRKSALILDIDIYRMSSTITIRTDALEGMELYV